jgi:hypothetical protein
MEERKNISNFLFDMVESKTPEGILDQKWTDYKGHCKLVNPSNKRKLEVIVVGTGLAGASAAASLGELGYKVRFILFPGFTTPCSFHCCPGWDQCSKKLSE